MLEMIGVLVASIGVAIDIAVFRLERGEKDDSELSMPDLRLALLDLDRILSEWILAAEVTNRAIRHYGSSGDIRASDLFEPVQNQAAVSDTVLRWLEPELGASYDDEIKGPANYSARVHQMFQIYAPEMAWGVMRMSKDRRSIVYDLLASVRMEDDRYQYELARKRYRFLGVKPKKIKLPYGTVQPVSTFMPQLRDTLQLLWRAQEELRSFIRSTFPLNET